MSILDTDETLNMARLLFERGDILRCVELLERNYESYASRGGEAFLECKIGRAHV